MEKTIKSILFLLLLSIFVSANDSLILKNQIRTTLTIAAGYIKPIQSSTAHLQGNIEYYLTEQISIRGEIFYNTGLLKNESIINFKHSLATGCLYHFRKKSNFDPYVGIMPGLIYAHLGMDYIYEVWGSNGNIIAYYYYKDLPALNPALSIPFGFNFYFEKWFHLFVNGNYTIAKHNNIATSQWLNEIAVSFGLGFNLGMIKPKKQLH